MKQGQPGRATPGPPAKKQDLSEARQRFAWSHASRWEKQTTTRIQSLPLQIRTQGLSTTVAVLLGEDRQESRDLIRLLAEWLLQESPTRTLGKGESEATLDHGPSGKTLLKICFELPIGDQDAYLAAQDDALSLLGEAKLLASALHPSEVYRDS